MRPRALTLLLSLALTAIAMLALSSSAFAQVAQPNAIKGSTALNIPVASGTNQPTVILGDDDPAAAGITMAAYVADLDDWVAKNFGWRSATPVTFVVFSNQANELATIATIKGAALSATEQAQATSFGAYLMKVSQPVLGAPAGWLIMVNTDLDSAKANIQAQQGVYYLLDGITGKVKNNKLKLTGPTANQKLGQIQYDMAHQYAEIMVIENSSAKSATWLAEGIVDVLSDSVMPGTLYSVYRPMLVAQNYWTNTGAPTLRQLTADWAKNAGAGGLKGELSAGMSYLGTQALSSRVGAKGLVSILKQTADGKSLESVLQSTLGIGLLELNDLAIGLTPSVYGTP